MKDKFVLNTQNILLLVIIVLVIWNWFNTKSVKTDVAAYKEKIENIQVEIDSAQAINEEMSEKVLVIKENITNITNEIHEIDNNIESVKQQTDEKVNNVVFIGNVELERLFADRYPNR